MGARVLPPSDLIVLAPPSSVGSPAARATGKPASSRGGAWEGEKIADSAPPAQVIARSKEGGKK